MPGPDLGKSRIGTQLFTSFIFRCEMSGTRKARVGDKPFSPQLFTSKE